MRKDADPRAKKSKNFKEGGFNFDKIYVEAMKMEELDTGRNSIPKIRMSGFPFCPKVHLFRCLDYLERGGSTWSYNGDFYCEIGTAIHSVLQKWLPRAAPGTILGDWDCVHCGKWVRVKDTHPEAYKGRRWKPYTLRNKVGPLVCPKCSRPMRYVEFEWKLKSAPASGHSDGILIWDPSTILGIDITVDNMYIVENILKGQGKTKIKLPSFILEYKSGGRMIVPRRVEPKMDHKCQAAMYVGAARELLFDKFPGLDMQGLLLKYISRDAPDVRSPDLKIIVDRDDLFYSTQIGYVNILDTAVMIGEKEHIKKLYMCSPCTEEKGEELYESCEWGQVCEELTLKSIKNGIKKIGPLYKSVRP